ncbi:hypothetical protein BH10ACI4_BH10ACI4_36620 [soil metagenome]
MSMDSTKATKATIFNEAGTGRLSGRYLVRTGMVAAVLHPLPAFGAQACEIEGDDGSKVECVIDHSVRAGATR